MDAPEHALEPLPYHFELRDYLKSQERELWDWFASAQVRAEHTENLRLDLLKSAYRLDAAGYPDLYRCVDEARGGLELDIPVTLYQAQNSPQPNATLYYMPGEGHVVFSGPVLTLLNPEELKSILGHELAHYQLWARDGGEFHVADRLIQAAAADPRAAASHARTARRCQLYTEIYADRGSLRVVGEVGPVVAGLLKIQTGLPQVSASAYLQQAEEIFAAGDVASEGVSHPEGFIRARALALWQEQGEGAASAIARMIEGAEALEDLDLLGQVRLSRETRRLLEQLLRPKWFQTPAVLGHARLFFEDFEPAESPDPAWVGGRRFTEARLREYVGYLLLDFASVDPELGELPLAAALELGRQLDLDASLEKIVAKELKLKVREVRRLREEAPEMLARAEVER